MLSARLALVLAGLLLADAAQGDQAQADEAAEAVTRWGLVGVWAVDCGRPAAPGHTRFTYSITSDGFAVHARDFGTQRDAQDIQEATIAADGSLTLRVHFHFADSSDTRVFTMVKDADGTRYRTVTNHNTKGSYSIRDGKFTNGNPSPWITRCGDPPSTPAR